jgi:hypothetical protein
MATESHGSDTRHGWQRLENKPNDINGEQLPHELIQGLFEWQNRLRREDGEILAKLAVSHAFARRTDGCTRRPLYQWLPIVREVYR